MSSVSNENALIEKKEKNIKETIAFLKENFKSGYEKFKNNEDIFFKIVMFHYNKFLKLCKSPTRMYEFMICHLMDIINGVIILSNENEKDFFNNLESTLIKKNKDYGSSFDKSVDKFGIIYLAIELDKKINRYVNLIETGNIPTYESVKDTLLDIAGYCILGLTYMNENYFDIKKKSESKLILDDCNKDFDELHRIHTERNYREG